MSDENAVEAHLHMTLSTTLVKNKMETPAEGMPPQKTQKISHVPSSQILDAMPLNAITNTPRPHKKPHSKSQLVTGTDRSIQTQLPFQPKSIQPIQESTPSSTASADPSDLETVQTLENQLEEAKQTIQELETQLNQLSTELKDNEQEFTKKEAEIEQLVEDGTAHCENLERQNHERELEIETLGEQVYAMEAEIDDKMALIAELNKQFEEFQDETMKELGHSELEEERSEVQLLYEKMDEGDMTMRHLLSTVPEMEENSDFLGTEALRKEIQEKEIYIQDLQIDLESFGVNLDDVLGLSINDEFEAVKTRYNLTKGSSLFKEVTRCQTQLSAKYERQFASMKHQFNVKLDQVNIKIRAHDDRITDLHEKITNAEDCILRSENDFKEAEMEQMQVRSRIADVSLEIEDVLRQLAFT
ncbi:hypothetical protein BGZ83_009136 [Gryganskiella cystojenkinii]|nr:hypothetical protein BGZ83_009136 [Gryganskiella cystojenkinii]